MKLCINCKWYDGNRHCTQWRWQDRVDGTERSANILAAVERDALIPVAACTTPDPCGPEAKHFEESPPKPPVPPPARPWWKRIFSPNTQGQGRRASDAASTADDSRRSL